MPLYELKVEGQKKENRLAKAVETHSKLLVTISVIVIIVSAALTAQILLATKRYQQLFSKLEISTAPQMLVQNEKDYMGTKLYPDFLYRLARLYYENANYDKTKESCLMFLKEFAEHPLKQSVNEILNLVNQDLAFLEQKKDVYVQHFKLTSHPWIQTVKTEDTFTPHPGANPRLKFALEKDSFEIELFDLETPATTRLVIELLTQKEIEKSSAFELSDDFTILSVKSEKEVQFEPEKTYRTLTDNMVVLEVKDGKVLANKFYLVKNSKNFKLQGYQIIGEIPNGINVYREIKSDSKLNSITKL
ncbi:MAG: hypothetical protein HY606_01530 [Planctomycetes bacterium]|nr:hypothetical protein [Planctomycetota bacterium]